MHHAGVRAKQGNARRARAAACLVVALLSVVVTIVTPGTAGASALPSGRIDRVLVVSLPGVVWPDLEGTEVPNLRRLFDQSALGALVTRAAGRRSSAGAAYLTIGAGSRADADELIVGQAFDASERYGDTSAAAVFAQRTGHGTDSGVLHLGVEGLIDRNDRGRFDPTLGAFGDALARRHVPRAVIANADGAQAVVDGSLEPYQRSAAAAVMTHDGVVPAGDVSGDLVVKSPGAPFGLRQDPDAVMRAFDAAWGAGGVVLVEASDLLRADLYGAFTTSEQQRALKVDALARADQLVGRLLSRVDPQHDAVLVMSPTSGRNGGLGITAVRAPGVDGGLLRSATSRRTGLVYLVDIAPTILKFYGIARPSSMEGQAFAVRSVNDATARTSKLVNMSRDGLTRDNRTTPTSILVVVLGGLLAVAAVLALLRWPRARSAVEVAALALLGFLAATYLAGPLHVGRSGNAPYWAFVFGFAFLFALGCRLLGRGQYGPLLIALGLTVALHLLDLVSGARLEFNTVFGYSATVGIRTAGEGNLTFAQLAAATIFFCAVLVWRRPSQRSVYAGVALLVVALLVMVAPPFGDDFGAALAALPAFALLGWLMLGHRVRVRTVLLLVGTVVAAALVVGFVDLLRPPSERTHIGRFFARVNESGFGSFLKTIRRKLDANLGSFSTARLMWVLPIIAAFVVIVWLSRRSSARRLVHDTPVFRYALVAFAVLLVLGFALNDSGISIPALMAVVFECVVAYVVLHEARSHTRDRVPSNQVPLRR